MKKSLFSSNILTLLSDKFNGTNTIRGDTMKIQTSSLNLQSAHNYSELYERKESLTIEEVKPESSKDSRKSSNSDRLEHDNGKKIRAGWIKNGYLREKTKGDHNEISKQIGAPEDSGTLDDDLSIGDMKTRIMKMVLEQITGKKISVYNQDEEKPVDTNLPTGESSLTEGEPAPAREVTMKYELNETYFEQESLTFEAVGQVTTESGEIIAFAASLSQNREFYQENTTSLTTTGKLTDPLVVNFDGRGAQLTSDKVEFDLNGDGTEEQISNLKAGSAFLALDKNGDGTINDGTELFGPSTGSGFGELSQLDSDKNGWIDENDDLFYQLRLWKPGHESSSLLERGVGAISLDSVGGSFQLKNSEQELLGAVKNQGVWLQEKTGKAGFIQELDLSA